MPPSFEPPQRTLIHARPAAVWQLRTASLPLGRRTLLMGIVNITPDSFSDGGNSFDPNQALTHALHLLDDGADILDLGGESTRPGSPAATTQAIGAAEEQRRVLPVLQAILQARPQTILSIDTYRASTARAAVEAGAQIVNDVSGLLWDPAMAATCARLDGGVVLMHTRGLPSQWKNQSPLASQDVLPTLQHDLRQRLQAAQQAGIASHRIVLDPGFGFGKQGPENWALLRNLSALHDLGHPLLIGLSRKGFLSPTLPAAERDAATHIADTAAILHGAHILRVHDIAGARHAADIADNLRNAG